MQYRRVLIVSALLLLVFEAGARPAMLLNESQVPRCGATAYESNDCTTGEIMAVRNFTLLGSACVGEEGQPFHSLQIEPGARTCLVTAFSEDTHSTVGEGCTSLAHILTEMTSLDDALVVAVGDWEPQTACIGNITFKTLCVSR